MSGKFESNKKKTAVLWGLAIALAAGLIALVMIGALGPEDDLPSTPRQTRPTVPVVQATQPQDTTGAAGTTLPGETTLPEETEGVLFDLGDGVLVTEYLAYTGAFMEDRTDEVVTDVLAIRVTNTGDESIQTMNIALTDGQTRAEFSLSTLLPGETVIALEQSRMPYSTAPEFDRAEISAVALFAEEPGMCEELVEIQCLDGVINVTNVSGGDITEDIFIYYKNYIGGVYYGGITYRLRIQGGLKADEIRQGSAAHFDPDNSAVVFVTCG